MMHQSQTSFFLEYAYGVSTSERREAILHMPFFRRNIYSQALPEDVAVVSAPKYYSTQRYRPDPDSGELIPVGLEYFPLDIDCDDLLQAKVSAMKLVTWLENYKIYNYELYFSGSKGFHIVLPSADLGLDKYYISSVGKTFVETYISRLSGVDALDLSVYNNRALFRMPNSINVKTMLYKIPITRGELFGDLAFIEELALHPRLDFVPEKPRAESDYTILKQMLMLSEDITNIITEARVERYNTVLGHIEPVEFVEEFIASQTIKPGTRHQVSLMLSAYFKALGYSLSEAEQAITNFMKGVTGSSTHVSQRVRESIHDVRSCYDSDVKFSIAKARELIFDN